MDITISDVIGTARVSATVAQTLLTDLYDRGNNSFTNLREIESHLVQALADVSLAKHMTEESWTETTYVGRWSR